ncbi:MAG: redox-regulated ATPase YchF [Dehalococcoidales bacterium]|nr:redox-regulated ATPase YchF [Dehalococcoidales bacterium]
MSINVGIIGLPQSGKTTVFNAFTGGVTDTSRRTPEGQAPNIGIVKVPDSRLQVLTDMFHPRKTVPIEVKFIDVSASVKGLAENKGFAGELLNQLSAVDTLVAVIRAFESNSILHPEGSLDVRRDIATMNLELTFSDLAIIERRLERIEASLKSARPAERQAFQRERELMQKFKAALENETPFRDMELDAADMKAVSQFQFLSAKPLLVAVNIGEEQLGQAEELAAGLNAEFQTARYRVSAFCGKLEEELALMDGAEAREFRDDYGLTESGLERAIRLSYEISEMISFFTVGDDECRAWPLKRGTPAQKAAGKIHSDLEKGFIRAETISYENLVKCGSLAEGRKRGVLKQEGKDYIVRDGDVISVLFNV